MFQPEITSHADHGVPAQSVYIPGHGGYDVRTDTLALVTEHLAHLSVRELRSRMTRACMHTEGVKAELGSVRRAELLFIATEYPTIYLPGIVQALGLECDQEGRYWVPQTMLCATCREDTPRATVVEVPGPVENMPLFVCPACAAKPASPFVADPANPTDDEIAAAIQRGLDDGSIIDSADFLAQAEAQAAGHYHDPLGKYDYCTTDHSATQDAPVLRFPGCSPVRGVGPVISAQEHATAASHPIRAIGSRAYFAGLSVVVEAVDTSGPYPVATVRYVATNRTEKIAADAVRLA
jgi:hypothetical protein